MCDPATAALAIGAVSSVAGTGLNYMSTENARKDAMAAMAANDEINNRLIDATQLEQQTAADKFSPEVFQNDVQTQRENIRDRLSDVLTGGFTDIGGVSTPDIVKQSDTTEIGKARDFASNFADALANLRSFDQNLLNRNIDIGRTAERGQLASNFIAGNSRTLDAKLAALDPSSPFGDALTAFGGAALNSAFGPQAATTNVKATGPTYGPPIPAKFR